MFLDSLLMFTSLLEREIEKTSLFANKRYVRLVGFIANSIASKRAGNRLRHKNSFNDNNDDGQPTDDRRQTKCWPADRPTDRQTILN